MYDERFTSKVNKILDEAVDISNRLSATAIGTEHLVYGILKTDNIVSRYLEAKDNLTDTKFAKKLEGYNKSINLEVSSFKLRREKDYTSTVRRVLNQSTKLNKCKGLTTIPFVMMAILQEDNCTAVLLLKKLINIRELKEMLEGCIIELMQQQEGSIQMLPLDEKAFKNLLKFGVDMTLKAMNKEYDKVSCREEEINRLIQILSRRSKSNPCLIGEAGVGKTAIIEGLAQRIVNKDVPKDLIGKHIISLDMGVLVAGTKYRGEFEERVESIIKEIVKDKDEQNVILFIDEIHTIVTVGNSEGGINISNLLKPALSRGEIRLIGATTISEYRQHIEKDQALKRRFQEVMVEEPTNQQTLDILRGIKPKYEIFHGVKVSENRLREIIAYTNRYMPERKQPDKSIDLLDEVCSKVKIRVMKEDTPTIRVVTKKDICETIALWTGIPLQQTMLAERERLLSLSEKLNKGVIGQEETIKKITNTLIRNSLGFREENKPIGSFLFAGNTGVGKTELAKCLAKELFDNEDNLIRIDMSEFMEQHTISNLIGAPVGYQGSERGGILTEQVRTKPYSVVLFDEIEKGHPDILNILLQILDEGYVKDRNGRKINFRHTIVILTTNIGSDFQIKNGIGFNEYNIQSDRLKGVKAKLREHFKPELLNRLDDIIVFNKLEDEALRKITNKQLKELQDRIKTNLKLDIVWNDSVVDYLIDDRGIQEYGVRQIKRKIIESIEEPLANALLKQSFEKGIEIRIVCENNKIKINILELEQAI